MTDNNINTLVEILRKCNNSQITLLSNLIESSGDLNSADSRGRTALMFSVANGYTDAVQVLLQNGADVNSSDINGVTALIIAAKSGNIDTLWMILGCSEINVNATGSGFINEGTALVKASEMGNIETVGILLDDTRLDLDFQNQGNRSIELAGIHLDTEDTQRILKIREMIRSRMKEKGLNITTYSTGNKDYLRAAWDGNLDYVQKLLRCSVDINTSNEDGLNALILASGQGNIEVVRLLLDWGIDINVKDIKGWTALMWAIESNHIEVARLLLNNPKLDINRHNQGNYAIELSHDPMISEIISEKIINAVLFPYTEK